MATTTNFGWDTPDDTDLVKDGAAAIRTLGNSIDTSFVDLKGGTTNQVLAKNSNTDLDFKWVADATGIPATIIDAKGDIIAGTAADTADRLAVGANNTVLTADSSTATGLKWAATSAPTKSYTLINSPSGTALTGATTINVTGISSTYNDILIRIDGASSVNSATYFTIEPNAAATGCNWVGFYTDYGTQYPQYDTSSNGAFTVARQANSAGDTATIYCNFLAVSGTGFKPFWSMCQTSGSASRNYVIQGFRTTADAVTSIQIRSSTGNLDAGTIYIYGA